MISVCIATYNGEKYILEQLQSILPQLSDKDEIIISDDNSTDKTIQIIKSLNDPRIKVFTHSPEKCKFLIDHSAHNFENALRHSSGDIIFLSDQDDKWLGNKVETMIHFLEKKEFVVSDCFVTDDNLNIKIKSYFTIRHKTYGFWDTFFKSPFLGSCMAFKREILQKALPFPKYGVGHDLWLAIVALKEKELVYIDEPLSYYRRHEGTVTNSAVPNNTSIFFKCKYRLYLLLAIFQRFIS